jgi:Domain of unknown function (DUF4440)
MPRILKGFHAGPNMKICDTCQRQYADSLQYCLEDGTVLTLMKDPQATLRLEARPTQPGSRIEPRVAWGAFAFAGLGLFGLVGAVTVGIILFKWSGSNSNGMNGPGDPSVRTANNGQPSSNPGATKADAERELDQINDDVGFALVHSDVAKLDHLLADDYRFVGIAGASFTKQDILTLSSTGNLSYVYLTTSDPKIEVSDDLTKGTITGHARSKGQLRRVPFNVVYFYRNTYEKRQGRWQLVHGESWY